jgi:hypothetical protein
VSKIPRLAPPPPKDPPGKGALATAADLIKWTTGFAVAELAFSIGLVGDRLPAGSWLRWLVVASWSLLALSIAAGALVYLRIPVKQATENYDVEHDRWFVGPGRTHHVAFALGTLFVGLAIVLDAALPQFRLASYRVRSATDAVAVAEQAIGSRYDVVGYGTVTLLLGAGELRSRPDVWRVQIAAQDKPGASPGATPRNTKLDVFVDALDGHVTVKPSSP